MDATARKVFMAWEMASKRAGRDQSSVPFAAYLVVTGRTPPEALRDVKSPEELCNFIYAEEGESAPSVGRSDALSQSVQGYRANSAPPSTALIGCLMFLPNLVLLLGVVAVVVREFSWIVLFLALAGRVMHGFARWLVARGERLARTYAPIAVLLIALSFVLSILHLFDVFTFY